MYIYAATLAPLALGLLLVLFFKNPSQTPKMAAGRQAITVPALKKHTATIIMAHGLGDSGAGWVQLAENWRRRGKFEDVKFIFPNAPNIPITINMGMRMPGWYDITSFNDLNQAQDEAGILRSRTTLTNMIDEEIKAGIPSTKIILGGFSQGGAMSLFTGLTMKEKLGGVFGLSCYLVLGNKIKDLITEGGDKNKDTPFFMGHGDADEVVKYQWGFKTAEKLRDDLGIKNVDFRTYPNLPHSAALEEIDDLEDWVRKCLGDTNVDKL